MNALAQFAQNFVAQVNANSRSTVYSYAHGTDDIPFVSSTGPQPVFGCPGLQGQHVARTDCSGWVSYALQQVAMPGYRAAKTYRDANYSQDPCPYPRAYIYYNFFGQAAPLFTALPVGQAQAGDVLVWAPLDWAQLKTFNPHNFPPGDTGHIMLVLQGGIPINPAAIQAQYLDCHPENGDQLVGVVVADSSTVTHQSLEHTTPPYVDCRANQPKPGCQWEGKPETAGLSWGMITFVVNAQGEFRQFCFDSTQPGNNFHPTGQGMETPGSFVSLIARPQPGAFSA